MIRSITAINPKGESLVLDLFHPEQTGIAVGSITGLGPPKANINSSALASADGSHFTGSRVTDRNIVVGLLFPDPVSVEEARQKTYKFFQIKKQVTLMIQTDSGQFQAKGYVESNEPDIFSRLESTSISIVCPDPYFYGEERESTIVANIEPMFEFPFSNESVTEALVQFGEVKEESRVRIQYHGDIDTGVVIIIHALGRISGPKLFNADTLESVTIDTGMIKTITGAEFDYGDDIILTTIKGKKSAYLLRSGLYTNIIGAVSKDSDWFELSNGDNVFVFSAEKGHDRVSIEFRYRNTYGGI